MKQISFAFLFFFISLIAIILENLNNFLPALITRALIIPALMIFYHLRVKGNYSLFHRLILFALLFAWFGDLLLQFSKKGIDLYFDSSTFFLLGIASFSFTQIFYSVAFNLPRGKNRIFTSRIYQLLMILGYGFLILWLLYNKLITETANYRFPVILYTMIILFMLGSALNRYGKVNGVSYMLVTIGALLFVFSDSLLAINRFYEKIDFARIIILASYILAQYLIAMGSLRQDFSREEV